MCEREREGGGASRGNAPSRLRAFFCACVCLCLCLYALKVCDFVRCARKRHFVVCARERDFVVCARERDFVVCMCASGVVDRGAAGLGWRPQGRRAAPGRAHGRAEGGARPQRSRRQTAPQPHRFTSHHPPPPGVPNTPLPTPLQYCLPSPIITTVTAITSLDTRTLIHSSTE